MATELARAGADVALVYRQSRAEAEETAAAVRALGRRAVVLQGDLREPDACERVVDGTVDALGRLDVLVNMASAVPREAVRRPDGRGLGRAARRRSARGLALRARGRAAHAAPARRPHHQLLGLDGAAAAVRATAAILPYYVAKAAVMALTEGLALELASDQILVNAIAPGPIVAPEGTSDEEFAAVERATPLGRWGGEIEIAKAVLALVDSDFITGETIRVDGGRHLK